MEKVNTETLKKRMATLVTERKKTLKILAGTNKKIEEWKDKNATAEEELQQLDRLLIKTAEALIALTAIPEEISSIRSSLMRSLERSERKDITVAEVEEARNTAKKKLKSLQEECVHTFILELMSSYEGSPTYDCDDRHPGKRICAICKYCEYSIKSEPTDFMGHTDYYKTLNPDDARIIKNRFRFPLNSDKNRLLTKLIEGWLPLEDIIRIFTPNIVK